MQTLQPIQDKLLSADAKEQRHVKIWVEAWKQLDFHTEVLKQLEVGNNF